MHATVMTRGRGRRQDYTFFPGPPGETWWRAYRSQTSFDYPTLLVEGTGDSWRLYAGGFPSVRLDSQSTRIEYALILEGDTSGDGGEGPAGSAAGLVRAWLTDDGRAALGRELDSWATEAAVDEWYREDGSAPDAAEVSNVVTAALRNEPQGVEEGSVEAPNAAPARVGAPRGGNIRVGGLGADGAPEAVTRQAAALLSGATSGALLLLNLLDFARWPEPSSSLVETAQETGHDVLILDTTSDAPVTRWAPAPPPEPRAREVSDPKGTRRPPLAAAAAPAVWAALGVVAILGALAALLALR